jgi:Transcriptional regulator
MFEDKKSDRANPMNSLERSLDVIGVMEEPAAPLRLSEIARRAHLHIATTQRIVNVLVGDPHVEPKHAGHDRLIPARQPV